MAPRSVADLDRIVSVLIAQVREESTQSITDVQLETGVEDADAVYLDTNFNTWRRSIVGDINAPERAIFHGVANVTSAGNSVRIYGFHSSDDFLIYNDDTDTKLETFVPGEFVYVSKRALGAYTQTPNEIQAGVAVGPDRFLLASELDNVTTGLRAIINNAKEQTRIEVTEAQKTSGYIWPTLQARIDSNYSRIEETDENIAALMLDLAAAYGSYASIDGRFSAIESLSDANTLELQASAGTATNLAARLAVGMDPDGTLKASVSASTYSTETETVTRIGANSFSVPVDNTGVYLTRRTVRINDTLTAHVNFSTYVDNATVVTLVESIIPATLSKIEYSFSPAEMPIIRHTDLTEVRTVDPTSTDTVRTKHVSNNDLKSLVDAIAANTSVVSKAGSSYIYDTGILDNNIPFNITVDTKIADQIAALGAASAFDVGIADTELATVAYIRTLINALETGLGTVATYDVGTAADQVPLNSDIVSGVGDWQYVTLGYGWSMTKTIRYRYILSQNAIQLQGAVQASQSMQDEIFTLAVGYRPEVAQEVPRVYRDASNGARNEPGRVTLQTNGNVDAVAVAGGGFGTGDSLSLDGIIIPIT